MNKLKVFLILGIFLIVGCGKSSIINPGHGLNDQIKPIEKIIIQKDWMFPLLILGGVGGGIFAMFLGYRSGIKIMAASFVLISIYLAFVQFHQWIAIAGFIGCMVLLIYTIVIVRKTIKENILGIQKLKELNPEVNNSLVSEVMNTEQSQTTKEIVNVVKHNMSILKLKDEYNKKKHTFTQYLKNILNGFKNSIQSK
jgi:hypothetical protein